MDTVIKTEEDWKKELTPEQYHALREKGTEAPFSGKYYQSKDAGMYRCAACGNELFPSDAKFDSGTGWPSFTKPVEEGRVRLVPDDSHGMHRTEVVCGRCGSHLGHVFDDGPQALDGKPASGKRFCINSTCLKFQKEGEQGHAGDAPLSF